MPVFSNRRAGLGLTVAEDDHILNFLNPKNTEYVDARTALKNSDIYSIIFQLSADLADGELKTDAPRAQGILDNPTQTSNAHSFWQSMFAQLLLGGECFAYRWRNKNGTDLAWEYLRPSQVQTYLLEDGSGLIYNINFDEPDINYMQAVPQGNMIHIRLLSRNGGKTGMSPLLALANELEVKNQSNRLTLQALKQAIQAPGVLSVAHGGLLDAKDKAARSRQFMHQMQGSDGGPIVIDDLETYTPIELPNNVAQLLNQVNWTGQQIAKVYGVSDSMLNGQGDQQSSVQMIAQDYAKCLSRFAKPIVGELNNKLSANITMDLRPAVDPLGDNYVSMISTVQKNGTIAQNQATWMLQQLGYLPDDLPAAKQPKQPAQVVVQAAPNNNDDSAEGGENEDEDDQS